MGVEAFWEAVRVVCGRKSYIAVMLMWALVTGAYILSGFNPVAIVWTDVKWKEKDGIFHGNNTPNVSSSKTHRTVLLLWTNFFGDNKWGYKDLSTNPFHRRRGQTYCDTDHCLLTNDKSRLNEADAVIFHCRDPIGNRDMLMKNRRPHHIFVLFCLESPAHSDFRAFDSIGMNASATYRLDSDFFAPYGMIIPKTNESDDGPYTFAVPWEGKTKSVVWAVSNCRTPSRRDLLVKELSKYIDVDVYGACGRNKCPRSSSLQCKDKFAKEYKFYLSLENSICKDYITEKFFQAMGTEIVPIVFGGAAYSRHAPEHSYINIRDFKSPRVLAEFLHKVGRNKTEYYEYLSWKNTHKVESVGLSFFCALCDSAGKGVFRRSARNLSSWWKTSKGVCDNNYIFRWKNKW